MSHQAVLLRPKLPLHLRSLRIIKMTDLSLNGSHSETRWPRSKWSPKMSVVARKKAESSPVVEPQPYRL